MTGGKAEIRDLRKRFGRKEVLRGVSLAAEGGSCVGLLGCNGSGKSTLLRVLAGVLRAQSGAFLWDGSDLLKDAGLRARTVAYVPQGTPLIEELSAWDNLRLWYEKDALQRSLEEGILHELGVKEFLGSTAGKLSGGMKKRLSIGCAMANDPQILLLDEPTAALDLVGKEHILSCFDSFRHRGGLILMATHDPWELELCDRWELLKDGTLQAYAYDGDLQRLAGSLES